MDTNGYTSGMLCQVSGGGFFAEAIAQHAAFFLWGFSVNKWNSDGTEQN